MSNSLNLLFESTNLVDSSNGVDIIDFCKAFDLVSHTLIKQGQD